MQTKNKIYSFFILLALLFWNPFSYYLFFKNSPIYELPELKLLYWVIFVFGLTGIFIIQKIKLSDLLKNISFMIALVGILYAFFVTVDRFYGLVKKENYDKAETQWLIFEPYSKARFKTFEFDYTTEINSLGLRDNEFTVNKGNHFRILCFGDSWTYGYGVNVEDSWPKVLEQNLSANGINNVQVINCARPGQFTGTYKTYMEKIIPLLNPDLVLVGVLQLDDLAQIYTNDFLINNTGQVSTLIRKTTSVILRYFKYSFSNFLPPDRLIEVTKGWKKINTSMVNDFEKWQKLRFFTLSQDVQDYFLSGDIDPSLLNYYINYPDRNIIFNDPNNPKTKFAINGMNDDVNEMKSICESNNSELVFVNIPINYFTGHKVIRSPSDSINDYLMQNNNIDSVYRKIAESNGLPYIELTEHFIKLPNKTEYLFNYDGHPNEKGYAEIGNYIADKLIEYDLVP